MAKAKSWEVIDEFWSRVEPLILKKAIHGAEANRSDGSHGGSGRAIFATT
jgi:hypothetical protein